MLHLLLFLEFSSLGFVKLEWGCSGSRRGHQSPGRELRMEARAVVSRMGWDHLQQRPWGPRATGDTYMGDSGVGPSTLHSKSTLTLGQVWRPHLTATGAAGKGAVVWACSGLSTLICSKGAAVWACSGLSILICRLSLAHSVPPWPLWPLSTDLLTLWRPLQPLSSTHLFFSSKTQIRPEEKTFRWCRRMEKWITPHHRQVPRDRPPVHWRHGDWTSQTLPPKYQPEPGRHQWTAHLLT